MQRMILSLFLLMSVIPAARAHAQAGCVAPALSDQRVKDIVDKERKSRTDLPAPFPQLTWSVQRRGCHYMYVEHGEPAGPERINIFWLNQYGVIVDATPGTMKCPDKEFSEAELADIVRKARASRKDLPAPFPKSTTHVVRLRCQYLYSEYAVPESKGNFQVFTIDFTGEVMDFTRPRPR